MPLSFLWLLVWIFHHQGINQKIAEESQGKGETFLVSSQDWQGETELVKSWCNSTQTQHTPFEGRKFDQPHFQGNHGDLRALEVQVLQKDFKSICKWMQPMPDAMAGVSGHRVCSSFTSSGLGLELSSKFGTEPTQPTQWQRQEGKVPAAEITSIWRQRSRTRRKQGCWQPSNRQAVWERQECQTECGQRQRQGRHHGSPGTTMDSNFASQQFTIAASSDSTAAYSRRNNIERIDSGSEEIATRNGSRSAGHCPKISYERWTEIDSVPLQCSRRSEFSEGNIGHCQIGEAQPAHQVAQFPDRCSPALAEAHRGFPTRRVGTDTANRGSQNLTCSSSPKIRGFEIRTGSPGDRCRSPCGHGGSINRCCGWRCSGSSPHRQPDDNALTVRDCASFSRSNGDRRGQQFQQKTASRRGIRAACAIFCAISHATSHATICATGVPGESKSAFSTARQEVTEVYPCLGHSSVLNWTHSACDESWFTTRWFAIESAYELAWKLGTPQTLVSDHHERKPSACGKRRQVCFSSDVELRFTMDPPLICATLVLDETRLHNWQQKPWRLHDFEILEFSDCIERAAMQVASSELFQTSGDVPNRTPLKSIENIPRSDLFKYNHERVQVQEPLSIEAALIRTSPKGAHQAPQPLTCHRSDDFYNVPSRWYGQAEHNANNENDQHEQHDEDDARFFLHEAPDSVQLVF